MSVEEIFGIGLTAVIVVGMSVALVDLLYLIIKRGKHG